MSKINVYLKIATINILNELSLWPQRKELLRRGLAELQPDVICLQEVRLQENNAGWLADELGYSLALCPKTGRNHLTEGIAILSRLPVLSQHCLDLGSQERVAQAVILAGSDGTSAAVVVNGHFFWQPGESLGRLRQVERLLEWIPSIAGSSEKRGFPKNPLPVVVCGDFNGTPETSAIARMRQSFTSAYAAVHGREPAYTCPTPLPLPKKVYLGMLVHMLKYVRPWAMQRGWRGTLDYIFASPDWQVLDCQVVLNQPAPHDPRLYPSDHFGLCAELEY